MVHGGPIVHDKNEHFYVMKYNLKNIIFNSKVFKNKLIIWIFFVNVNDGNSY